MDRLSYELIIAILERCTHMSANTLLTASQLSRAFHHVYQNKMRLLKETAALRSIPWGYLGFALAIGNQDLPFIIYDGYPGPGAYRTSDQRVDVGIAKMHIRLLRQDRGALANALRVHHALDQLAQACSSHFKTHPQIEHSQDFQPEDRARWYLEVYQRAMSTTHETINSIWTAAFPVLERRSPMTVTYEGGEPDEPEQSFRKFLAFQIKGYLLDTCHDGLILMRELWDKARQQLCDRDGYGAVDDETKEKLKSLACNMEWTMAVVAFSMLEWRQCKWRRMYSIHRTVNLEERAKAMLAWVKEQEATIVMLLKHAL